MRFDVLVSNNQIMESMPYCVLFPAIMVDKVGYQSVKQGCYRSSLLPGIFQLKRIQRSKRSKQQTPTLVMRMLSNQNLHEI